MSINQDEYKSIVGLKNLYVAAITADSASAYTTGTPEYLAPAADARFSINASQDTQYADDQAYDVDAAIGDTGIELTVTNVPPILLAALVGDYFDPTTGRVVGVEGTPPWYALGFQSLKSNGKYRYYWYYKVQFVPAEEGFATKADKATPQPIKLIAKAVKSTYKWTVNSVSQSAKRTYGDEDTDSFSGTSWFSQVQVPGAVAQSALALSTSDPTDGEASVPTSQIITLTFNNALTADAIYNVTVATAAGVLKACTNVLDTTKKILTITPPTALAGATTYLISMGVTDIYGQSLLKVNDFATA